MSYLWLFIGAWAIGLMVAIVKTVAAGRGIPFGFVLWFAVATTTATYCAQQVMP